MFKTQNMKMTELNVVTRLKRLENEWNDLDMEKDHITETMQSIRKEILEIQFKGKGLFAKQKDSEVTE